MYNGLNGTKKIEPNFSNIFFMTIFFSGTDIFWGQIIIFEDQFILIIFIGDLIFSAIFFFNLS